MQDFRGWGSRYGPPKALPVGGGGGGGLGHPSLEDF